MKTGISSPPQGTVRDWLDQRADENGDRTAYTFFDAPDIDWAGLRKEARALAARLTGAEIAKGESIAILQPNGRDAIINLFGVLYGGFRATVINLVAGDEAIGYALGHSEARFALVDDRQIELFERVRPAGMQRMGPIGEDAPSARLHPLGSSDDALLMYTSGTTGRPKGVVHSHASLLAGGWTAASAHDLTDADCGLCVLPIYHINGLCVSVMSTLITGGRLAVAPKFSASSFWNQCETAEVTWFSVVPTIISHLLHSDTEPGPACRARMRFGRSASSALAPAVQVAFEERFGVPIVETMGLTETAAQILSNPLPPGVRKIGSPGRAYGNEACILSGELRQLPANSQGEIAVRGPNVMRGYFRNDEATRDTFGPDGWLRTGDLGYMDDDGYVFVTGRLKELIIKGGENIAPREIDEALYSHPDVVEAAAFARPCDTYGERVEAAVKLREGSPLTSEALLSICVSQLGAFKSPDRIHLMEDLPKGPSGKIQRIKLPEMTG